MFVLGHKNWYTKSGGQEKGHWSQIWIQFLNAPTGSTSVFQLIFKLINSLDFPSQFPPRPSELYNPFLSGTVQENDTRHKVPNISPTQSRSTMYINFNHSEQQWWWHYNFYSLTHLFICSVYLENASMWLEKRIISTYST